MAVTREGLRPARWCDDLLAGMMARVSYTGEKWIMSDCSCGLRGASRSKVGLVGGCGLSMETCGKRT